MRTTIDQFIKTKQVAISLLLISPFMVSQD